MFLRINCDNLCDNLFVHSSKGAQYPISKPAVLKLFGLRILYHFQKITEDVKELLWNYN